MIIDAAHGGNNYGSGSNNLWLEKDIVLKISLYQYKRFKELGLNCILTRKDDSEIDGKKRIELIKSYAVGCNCCLISNHIGTLNSGFEIFHSINQTSYKADEIRYYLSSKYRVNFCGYNIDYQGIDMFYMLRMNNWCDSYIINYGNAFDEIDKNLIFYHWPCLSEAVVYSICSSYNIPYFEPDYFYHIVRDNETIDDICKHYRKSLSKICHSSNHISKLLTGDYIVFKK